MPDPISAPSDQMVSEVCRTGDCMHPDWPDTCPTEPVPVRVLAAEDRRRFRQLLEDGSLGCPNTPRCGRMLVDHAHEGWAADGSAINPRCPEATT